MESTALMTNKPPIIECRAVGPFMKNGYLLACPDTMKGIYIDPGDEASQVLTAIREHGIELMAVVNTHAHLDHICGIGDVKAEWDVPVYLHPEDQVIYDRLPEQAEWFGLEYEAAPPVDRQLSELEPLHVGRLEIKVHHTPGHSPGHVCLDVGEHLFCGDTVFAGSIGRTDLPRGSYEVLIHSIREVIIPLGDSKILYPGHGPSTTIGTERARNPPGPLFCSVALADPCEGCSQHDSSENQIHRP